MCSIKDLHAFGEIYSICTTFRHRIEIEEIIDCASKELNLELQLNSVEEEWTEQVSINEATKFNKFNVDITTNKHQCFLTGHGNPNPLNVCKWFNSISGAAV